jgi:PAS domain S-box-containing protein
MNQKPKHPSPSASELRERAEKQLQARQTGQKAARADADTQRLVHELQVHQIELEMQNEELRRAQAEIESALEKITDLYDFAPVAYLTLAEDGVIHDVNFAGATLLGTTRSALDRQHFRHFVSPADRATFDRFLQQVFSEKSRERCELTLHLKGKLPCLVELVAIVTDPGRTCRVSATDITERVRAAEDRLVLSKLETTGILAGGIAHDFNNLLATIVLGLELAKDLGHGKEQENCLDELRENALAARRLTQQLLTFSKGHAFILKEISLLPLIKESTELALHGSAVRCVFSLAEDLWPVLADEDQIGQSLRNLVLNAREAMPEGGVVTIHAANTLCQAEEIPTLVPGRYVRLRIIDEGIGIPPENLARIFDPYFSTKQRGEQKGMGLGLTICHTVAQTHGGTIVVKSEPSRGATFDLILPAAPSSQIDRVESQPEPLSKSKHYKLLVMDDDDTLRKLYGQALCLLGHEVELVEDGQLAIAAFRNAIDQGHPFDLVFLDLTIRDGMGGREAVKALQKIKPDVRAIVMSGYGEDPVVAHYNRYGFAGILNKPFDIRQVEQVLLDTLSPGTARNTLP